MKQPYNPYRDHLHGVLCILFLFVIVYANVLLNIVPIKNYWFFELNKVPLAIPLLLSSFILILFTVPPRSPLQNKALYGFLIGAVLLCVPRLMAHSKETGVAALALFLWAFWLSYYKPVISDKTLQKIRWTLGLLILLSVVSFICQFAIHSKFGRYSLSVLNPNNAGIIMILFLYLSHKMRSALGQGFALICLFILLSRSYLYSTLIMYLLVWKAELVFAFIKKYRISMAAVIFTLCTLTLLLSMGLDKVLAPSTEYQNDVSRLTSLSGASSHARIHANAIIPSMMSENSEVFLMGYGDTYDSAWRARGAEPIHNSFLEMLGKYGILYFVLMILAFSKVLEKFLSKTHLPYILSYFVYAMAMHDLLDSKYLIVFFAILLIPESWTPKTSMVDTIRLRYFKRRQK